MTLMMTMTNYTDCKWHEQDEPVGPEGIGCQDCGKMLATKTCLACGKEFLDWEDRNHDDILSGPYVTEAGDLCCISCGRIEDARMNRDDDWDTEDWYGEDEEAEVFE